MTRGLLLALFTFAFAFAYTSTAAAQTPSLNWPVDCTLGESCFLQNFVDNDPGYGRKDYACGRLSYDGHKGTDIRLTDFKAMQRGVKVLAAAGGKVTGIRNNVKDTGVKGMPYGKDAGNSVIIDHGDGWETQYAHMMEGSVSVKFGERVKSGQTIGLIGYSGKTEFPHLHISVRHKGETIDPFTGPCSETASSLWKNQPAYRSTDLVKIGFAAGKAEVNTARTGAYDSIRFSAHMPALVLWVDVFGAQAGDVQTIKLTKGNGSVIHQRQETLQKSNVSWFAFSGMKRPQEGWPETIIGNYTLSRNGKKLIEKQMRLPGL